MQCVAQQGQVKGMAISRDDIVGITEKIWTSMLDMQLIPASEPLAGNGADGYVVANIQLIGGTEYAVRLDFDYRLAQEAATRLLGMPLAELSTSDVRDAAGEMANMTGGGVKTLLGNTLKLSLPSVVSGKDFEFTIRHGKIVLQTYFHSEHGQMMVTIVERTK